MATDDFFRARLDAMIDLKHPLAVLSTRLPWAAIEVAVAPKLARQVLPAKRLSGKDLLGTYVIEIEGKFDSDPLLAGLSNPADRLDSRRISPSRCV